MKFRPPEIRNHRRLLIAAVLLVPLFANLFAQEEPSASLNITAKPGTLICVDTLEYGALPDSGELTVHNLRAGVHIVRARLKGMREISQTVKIAAGSEEAIELKFSAAADEAEESFQSAEELRGQGDQVEAIKAYRKAIKLR